MRSVSRRGLLTTAAMMLAVTLLVDLSGQGGDTFAKWTPGTLDIPGSGVETRRVHAGYPGLGRPGMSPPV